METIGSHQEEVRLSLSGQLNQEVGWGASANDVGGLYSLGPETISKKAQVMQII
jgi:hypothetical protein